LPKEILKRAQKPETKDNSGILGQLTDLSLRGISNLQNLDGAPMKNGYLPTPVNIGKDAKLPSISQNPA
jgi:hypothetical protein